MDIEYSSDSSIDSNTAVEVERNEDEYPDETPQEKRLRLANQYLSLLQTKEKSKRRKRKRVEGDESNELELPSGTNGNAIFSSSDSEADSEVSNEAISRALQKDVLEAKGALMHPVCDILRKLNQVGEVLDLEGLAEVSTETIDLCNKPLTGCSLFEELIKNTDDELVVGKSFAYCSSKDCNTYQINLDTREVKMFKGLINSKAFRKVRNFPGHRSQINCIDVSEDGTLLATGSMENEVFLWNTEDQTLVHRFRGHRDSIFGVVFEKSVASKAEESRLYSCSKDRTIRIWDVNARCPIDEQYGHQSHVMAIDCLTKPRVVTSSMDLSVRYWKVQEETQLVFDPKSKNTDLSHTASIDCVKFIDESQFVSGSEDGSIKLWNLSKKKPAGSIKPSSCHNGKWITAIGRLLNSDIFATAAENEIKFWQIDVKRKKFGECIGVIHVNEAFINGLSFGKIRETEDSISFTLIAAIGGEQRLGRWKAHPNTKGSIKIFNFVLPKLVEMDLEADATLSEESE